ncbi:hypothetical protein FOA43_004328 [Brettanomyces nanus]|uniref:RRM domain-containing protein n=1 Tax=Eeniella nana TaxID=13502 RepID=A0A875SE44_EENNA|nr:uncharacterized protein FOA43_004328 [Brettanomyces nanus]QPG76934.1 hypothetical protein FOA43_004328 [Brettanomyces nanus]
MPSHTSASLASSGNNRTDSSHDLDSTAANAGGPSTIASIVGTSVVGGGGGESATTIAGASAGTSSTVIPAVSTARRPSISSLSSASGYASSVTGDQPRVGVAATIGTPSTTGATTGGSILGSRVPSSRHPGSMTPLSQVTQLHASVTSHTSHGQQQSQQQQQQPPLSSSWLPQQQTNPLLNVTPWIEQQAQVSPMQNLSTYSDSQQAQLIQQAQLARAQQQLQQQQQQMQQQVTNLSLLTQTRAVPMNPSSTAGSISGSIATAGERQAPQPTGYAQYGNFPRSPATNNDTATARRENGNNNNNSNHISTSNHHGSHDEEIIPTAVVIKNIPFAIKKEQLLDFMAKINLPLPYAFNYHFDNGVFRGLAFANFNTTEETSLVVNLLNGREIGGRKLRVEYKKMLPPAERERIEREKRERRGQLEEQHRSASATSLVSMYSIASAPPSTNNLQYGGTPITAGVTNPGPRVAPERLYVNMSLSSQLQPPSGVDMNNPDALEIFTKLVLFRDESRTGVPTAAAELVFQAVSLSGNQRRMLSLLSQFLGLVESQENGFIVIRISPENMYQVAQNTGGTGAAGNVSSQIPPALMRSHSHSILNSASALSMNTGRYRQQSPRSVSQQASMLQQNSLASSQFGMNSFAAATQGTLGTLHHSASAASLNFPRQGGGFTAPPTPNPQRMAFGNNALTGGLNTGFTNFGNNFGTLFGSGSGSGSGAGTSSGLPAVNTAASFQPQGFNNPQLTGGSTMSTHTKGLDDLFVGMENLSFER